MHRELRRTTELHALGLRSSTAITGASKDQGALKLGQAAEHCQHQPAVSCCGIGPSIVQALEARIAIRDLLERVEQIPRRARQAIQSRDDKHVAGLEPTDCLGERSASPTRIVPAYGKSAPESAAHRAAAALAAKLGEGPVEFPDGHTGWLLRPKAFAAKLCQSVERAKSKLVEIL